MIVQLFVDTDACSVKSGAVGLRIVENCYTISKICAVRHRKACQKRLSRRTCVLSGTQRRNAEFVNLWLAKPEPFIRKKEERPVLHKRPAKCSTKVILAFFRFMLFRKPICSVENIIPKIVESVTMPLIRPRTG